jgi:GTP cyclohydrolase I
MNTYLTNGTLHSGYHSDNGHRHPKGHPPLPDDLEVGVTWTADISLATCQSPFPPFDTAKIAAATHAILEAVGEEATREGLLHTPHRVARAYEEMLSGYRTDPVALVNDALFTVEYDDLVIVRDIEFYSLCEHHLLPFIGRAHVAYISQGTVIGLSKMPRLVDMFARRLQVQERMTHQIAAFLSAVLHPRGVAVVLDGIHLCAMIRGVRKEHASMTTSAMHGIFREDENVRREFLAHISRSGATGGF